VDTEQALERAVSRVIGAMPFLWLAAPDPPGRESARGVIEANGVALLSNWSKTPIDPPSPGWLGRDADRAQVRESGLWNVNHVDGGYDPAFLAVLAHHIEQTPGGERTP
jgi:hypothetical protein